MKHRLIIIDGPSTVGKSTTSKSVYRQIVSQDKAYWVHEECENHPIRFQEFEAGNIHSIEGMELNRKDMLQKWEQFREEIQQSDKVYITEGCFLHSVDRYLLESVWDEDEVINYFLQIIEILRPLNPLIAFLHRPDIKLSFEKAFKQRGDWWREMVLGVPEPYGYFKEREYTGDDSIFDGLAYEQDQMSKIFDVLCCTKLKVDTSNECWEDYVREIVEKAGYEYHGEENWLQDIEKYCGSYQIEGGEDTWNISFDQETKRVYTSLFWPYMPMRYMGNQEFELISFPVTLQFNEEQDQFIVKGNYYWDYNNKRFTKI